MFKNQILFFSLIGRETILMICCLLISCHISTRLPAKSLSENKMVQTKQVFSKDDFYSALVEAPTYNSLKTECCSGKMFWRFSQRLSGETTKVLECFRIVYKMKTAIYFLARLLGSPRSYS